MDRVWLVSEFYYPVVVTTGYYVTEIADYLSKKGMNVVVIYKYTFANSFLIKSTLLCLLTYSSIPLPFTSKK